MKLISSSRLIFASQLIWWALLMGQGILFLILFAQIGIEDGELGVGDFFRPATIILSIIAAANAVMSWFFPLFALTSLAKKFPSTNTDKDYLSRSFVPFVISLAFAEAVSLMGFVAALMIQKAILMLPYMLVATLIFLLRYPSLSLFQQWNRNL